MQDFQNSKGNLYNPGTQIGGQNPLVSNEGDPSDATRMKEAQGLNEIFRFCLDQR